MLESLYKTSDLKEIFGDYFVGPEQLEPWEETLIARFNETENDGHGVEVYCTSTPAMFFKIVALDSKNSIGEFREGFTLSTGSGDGSKAFLIAEMINDGMLVLK